MICASMESDTRKGNWSKLVVGFYWSVQNYIIWITWSVMNIYQRMLLHHRGVDEEFIHIYFYICSWWCLCLSFPPASPPKQSFLKTPPDKPAGTCVCVCVQLVPDTLLDHTVLDAMNKPVITACLWGLTAAHRGSAGVYEAMTLMK